MGCLNFSNPFKASKWLSLIAQHSKGLKLRPNLELNKRFLGFSFRSNDIGFRGPMNSKEGKFILGTSYAMGFGVDADKCWYNYGNFASWCNVSFPTGIDFLFKEIDVLSQGHKDELLILYHPNIWKLYYDNYSAQKLNQTIFEYYNWNLYPRVFGKLHRKYLKSILYNRIYNYSRKSKLYFNPSYAYFDFKSNRDVVNEMRSILAEERKNFRKITLVKLPTKESLLNENRLLDLQMNYDTLWNKFVEFANPDEVLVPDHFVANDYHKCDTHWNERGNRKFGDFLSIFL